MTMNIVYTVLAIGLLANVVYGFKFFRAFVRSARVSGVAAATGENDNPEALRSFVWLIREAKDSLELFDDGNNMTESVYEQHELVAALQQKLEENPDFKVTCYFNDSAEDLLFRRAFANHAQVEIFAGLDPQRTVSKEIHYKIVDGGRLGYISQHGYSESERHYQRWDCRHLPDKQVKAKAGFLYSKMRDHAHAKRAQQHAEIA